jgi:hypothetical protein
MLTRNQQDPIRRPLHPPLEMAQLPPRMGDLALEQHNLTYRHRPQVGQTQRPSDAHEEPEPGLVDQGQGDARAPVEQAGRRAAVHVVQPVVVLGLDGELEGDGRVGGHGRGVEFHPGEEVFHVGLFGGCKPGGRLREMRGWYLCFAFDFMFFGEFDEGFYSVFACDALDEVDVVGGVGGVFC